MKRAFSPSFLFAKDYRLVTPGWQGAPCFRRYGPWAGLKTDDFVKEKVGGATVVRLMAQNLQPRPHYKGMSAVL